MLNSLNNPMIRRQVISAALVFLTTAFSIPAHAVVDYSSLTSAIDVAGVTTAMLAAAGLMIAVVVARWGIRKIIAFFR